MSSRKTAPPDSNGDKTPESNAGIRVELRMTPKAAAKFRELLENGTLEEELGGVIVELPSHSPESPTKSETHAQKAQKQLSRPNKSPRSR